MDVAMQCYCGLMSFYYLAHCGAPDMFTSNREVKRRIEWRRMGYENCRGGILACKQLFKILFNGVVAISKIQANWDKFIPSATDAVNDVS